MNSVILCGRLVKDPDVKYTSNQMCIARYTLAVNRKFAKTGEQGADFINCIAFGKNGEFAEKYLKKGTKIILRGKIQTGSYTNKDGQKVYTTDVIVDEQEFAESKSGGSVQNGFEANKPSFTERPQPMQVQTDNDGFMKIPEGIEDNLPFF